MKKFISMVMAAAMVVTMVPATAFALDGEVEVSAKVLKAMDVTASSDDIDLGNLVADDDVPELRIKATDVKWKGTHDDDSSVDFKITLNNAKFNVTNEEGFEKLVTVVCDEYGNAGAGLANCITNFEINDDADVIEFTFTHYDASGKKCEWHEGDVMWIDLDATLTKTKVGTKATVSAKASDIGLDLKDEVFATVVEKGIKVELDDDVVSVAEEEIVTLENIVVTPVVGDTIGANVTWDKDTKTAEFVMKLSKGFEWATATGKIKVLIDDAENNVPVVVDGNKLTITMNQGKSFEKAEELVFKGLEVEATTAKSGDVCTLTVDMDNVDKKGVEVAKVIDYKVVMELNDADEDVPVFYSGVNVKNDGLNDDADHVSLEVDLYETFAGAWDMDKAFTLALPEGVYVTNVISPAGDLTTRNGDNLTTAFKNAYVKGGHVEFEFAKRVFVETDPQDDTNRRNYTADVTFALELVADPGFVGDVVLKLEGAAVDTQEVTIAKFVAPMTVKAEQNDVIIDYRYTAIETPIVVTEAEAGLWDKDLEIGFAMDKFGAKYIDFEDDATVTVDEASEMEVKKVKDSNGLKFTVTAESDDEAAEVTIDGIETVMHRSIPAGPYALNLSYTAGKDKDYKDITLLGQEKGKCHSDCETGFIGDVCDFSTEVHEAWINVVTAGRDQDDASFTTKVVVPVGESYIVAGDKQIALDVPAYINADGYTMLPVRAVATALGINNDAVQWNQATKTVIIMYGQRIITMTAGQSVVYVSGTAIPAASAVEIVDGRAFLGLRDLATTLGVATINWDPATKVASLN